MRKTKRLRIQIAVEIAITIQVQLTMDMQLPRQYPHLCNNNQHNLFRLLDETFRKVTNSNFSKSDLK